MSIPRLGVRGKLFLVSVALILVAVIPGGIYLQSNLRSQLENRIESELFHHAGAAREMAREIPGSPAISAVDPVADRLGRATSARITIIDGEGVVVVLHDVTNLRRLETIRQDFVANVSHELRTPVSVIRANTETLLDGALADPQRAHDFLEALQRNADRLAHLINDLLDISRIDSGRYKIDIRPIQANGVVRGVIEAMAAAAQEKDIALASEGVDGLQVLSDEKALHQVLLNLVDNAIKYTPEGGRVIVRARKHENHVRIDIVDDGPGIERKHRDRVFERFYRVDTGRSRKMGGTGLGLSIAKNLMETMGGAIGYEPGTPHGSIFWLRLPSPA